jgi:hypothetical protein
VEGTIAGIKATPALAPAPEESALADNEKGHTGSKKQTKKQQNKQKKAGAKDSAAKDGEDDNADADAGTGDALTV